MSIKRTPNGRTIKNYAGAWDFIETVERLEKSLYKGAVNTAKTIKFITPERRERQTATKKQELENKKLKNELENEINRLKNELENQMLDFNQNNSVEDTIKHFSTQLYEFKTLSEKYFKLQRELSYTVSISEFNNLFLNLAKKNIEFLLYSPLEVFYISKITFNLDKLNEEQFSILKEKFIKNNLLNNKNFKANYIKYFPELINLMDDISDIYYALAKQPEQFKNFKDSIMYHKLNLNNFYMILSRSPKTLLYMPQDLIEKIAENKPNKIGEVIVKEPETITVLNDNFFKKYSVKLIFENISKEKIKNKLKDYIDKYPTIKYYINNRATVKNINDPLSCIGINL